MVYNLKHIQNYDKKIPWIIVNSGKVWMLLVCPTNQDLVQPKFTANDRKDVCTNLWGPT